MEAAADLVNTTLSTPPSPPDRNEENHHHHPHVSQEWLMTRITRLSHFDYVQPEDLERIGLSKPGARRLLEAAKKKRGSKWRKKLDKLVTG
ncbi:hypothetical protein GE061_015437 [Apolygus lucorum]|uniref:non-specific protein-tyrosine kinase n=1 Tax=Apolygus lucorum TaxID=248454 RepID=A0A8S9XN68_APOLU|nr:hypothetical protein GE061_015437 [Apolygus lucorum]